MRTSKSKRTTDSNEERLKSWHIRQSFAARTVEGIQEKVRYPECLIVVQAAPGAWVHFVRIVRIGSFDIFSGLPMPEAEIWFVSDLTATSLALLIARAELCFAVVWRMSEFDFHPWTGGKKTDEAKH